MVTRSSIAGALLGCAVGDAMGAPFEGLWDESIPAAESLIESFHEYHGFPNGQYTDDTQLTIATVESIVESGGVDIHDIATCIAEFWRHHTIIGPGGACTHAAEHFLRTGDCHAMGAPIGQAGNGTAMRTAILGPLFWNREAELVPEVVRISRLTHTDPRSVAGGVAIAEAGRWLTTNAAFDCQQFCQSIADAVEQIAPEFAAFINELPDRCHSESVLDFIASAGQDSPEFDRPIITPFVVPTVLASLYAIITEPDSWSSSVTVAIRLGGDVDTLGAIVGALAGIRHGLAGIPDHFVMAVQNSESLQHLAAQYYATIIRLTVEQASQ